MKERKEKQNKQANQHIDQQKRNIETVITDDYGSR
jgi:hypothetical protein